MIDIANDSLKQAIKSKDMRKAEVVQAMIEAAHKKLAKAKLDAKKEHRWCVMLLNLAEQLPKIITQLSTVHRSTATNKMTSASVLMQDQVLLHKAVSRLQLVKENYHHLVAA